MRNGPISSGSSSSTFAQHRVVAGVAHDGGDEPTTTLGPLRGAELDAAPTSPRSVCSSRATSSRTMSLDVADLAVHGGPVDAQLAGDVLHRRAPDAVAGDAAARRRRGTGRGQRRAPPAAPSWRTAAAAPRRHCRSAYRAAATMRQIRSDVARPRPICRCQIARYTPRFDTVTSVRQAAEGTVASIRACSARHSSRLRRH